MEPEVSVLDILVVLLERKRFIVALCAGGSPPGSRDCLACSSPIRGEDCAAASRPESSIGSSLLGQLGNMGALGSLASLEGGSLGPQKTRPTCMSLC